MLNGTGSQQPAIDNPPQPPAPGYIFTPSVYSSARTEPCIQTHASEFQRLSPRIKYLYVYYQLVLLVSIVLVVYYR